MFVIGIGLAVLVVIGVITRRWFWYLVGAGFLLMFVDAHTAEINAVLKFVVWGVIALAAVALVLLVLGAQRAIVDRQDSPRLDELPAPTTEYETSPAYVPPSHTRYGRFRDAA